MKESVLQIIWNSNWKSW